MDNLPAKQNTGVAVAKNEIIPHANKLVVLLQGKLIKDCTDLEVVAKLSPALEKARFDLGLKIDNSDAGKKDNRLFVDALLTEIRLFYYTMALDEIPVIIFNGSRAKYDPADKVFLSVAAVSRWFATYMVDQDRIDARKQLEVLRNPTPVPPTPYALFLGRVRLICQAYDKYRLEGKYEDYNNIIYDSIERFKKMPFAPERKRKFLADAKTELAKEAATPAVNVFERKRQTEYLKALQEGRLQSQITAKAKKLALCAFFNDLAEVDESIILYLKTKEDATEL